MAAMRLVILKSVLNCVQMMEVFLMVARLLAPRTEVRSLFLVVSQFARAVLVMHSIAKILAVPSQKHQPLHRRLLSLPPVPTAALVPSTQQLASMCALRLVLSQPDV